MGDITLNIAISLLVRSFENTHSELTFRCSTVPPFPQFHNIQWHRFNTFDQWLFVLDHRVFVIDHGVFVLDQWVFVLDHGVFVLDHRVFVLDHGVFILDQWVFVLDHGVFVLDHRVFVLDQWVLGLRSSFLGLRFRNTLWNVTLLLVGIVKKLQARVARSMVSAIKPSLNIMETYRF